MVVKFGTVVATVISVSTSNTDILVRLPYIGTDGSLPVSIEFNSETSNTDVTFEFVSTGLPTIQSVNPTSATPVQKGDLVITGTGSPGVFGSVPSAVEVWLVKDSVPTY